MRAPKSVEVGIDWKIFSLKGTWEPNDVERRAAWELYVELITRISVVPLRDGVAREALSSLYALFAETRKILRAAGPEVAEPKPDGEYNLGFIAVSMLNFGVRPVLSYWHPELQAWEARREGTTSVVEHERAWPQIDRLRGELEQTRIVLQQYAGLLATACGVPDLSVAVPRR